MPADDREDDGGRGLPPDPLDRLWFHPSELGAHHGTPGRPARREWTIAGIAALLGAALALGALALAGTLDGKGPSEASEVLAGLTIPGFGPLAEAGPALIAATGAGVVTVAVTGPDTGLPLRTWSGVAIGRTRVLTSAAIAGTPGEVTVATADGRVLDTEVVGIDPTTDLAVLHLTRGELSPVPLGSPDDLHVGQPVIALGMAGGDHRWVGQGVVSALDRVVTAPDGTWMCGLVETDIEPGGAAGGGALLDADGAVVAILSSTAPGRATPIDVARDVAEQIAANGRARHGWLGVITVDAENRPGGGARVTFVTPGGPAEAGGIAPGDVIVALGGGRVSGTADLATAVVRRKPGDPLTLTVRRGESQAARDVMLGERGALVADPALGTPL